MGFFRSVGRNVAKPYTHLSQDVTKSIFGIKKLLTNFKDIAENANEKRKNSLIFTPTNDAREGFEALYKANKWTPEQLAKQRKMMAIFKWVFLIISWIAFCSFFAVSYLTWGKPWSFLFGSFGTLVVAGTFMVRAVQFSLYQTQIDERALIRLKDYWSRKDFWSRLFA